MAPCWWHSAVSHLRNAECAHSPRRSCPAPRMVADLPLLRKLDPFGTPRNEGRVGAVGKSDRRNLTRDRQDPFNINMLFQVDRKRIKRSIHRGVETPVLSDIKAQLACPTSGACGLHHCFNIERGAVTGPGRPINQNSMPLCAFTPSSNGCFTSVISVTRSAASISSGFAFRPVRQTCVIFGFSVRRKSTTSSMSR